MKKTFLTCLSALALTLSGAFTQTATAANAAPTAEVTDRKSVV